MVGLVFGDLMAEAHQVHQREIRDDKIVTVLIIFFFFFFFLPEGNIDSQGEIRFPFFATAHRDFKFLYFLYRKWMKSDNN